MTETIRVFVGILVFGLITMYGRKVNAMNLELTPKLSVDGTYTDNTFSVSDHREGDFQVIVRPSMSLKFSFTRGESSLDYGFTMRAYSESKELAQLIDHNVNFAYQIQWTPRFGMSLSDHLVLSSDRTVSFTTDLKKQIGTILVPEKDVLNNAASTEFSYEMTAVSRSSIGYTRRLTRYKDPTLADVSGDSILLRYQNQLSQNGEILVSYRFLNESVGVGKFQINAVEAEYTITMHPTIAVDISSGLFHSDVDRHSHLSYGISIAREFKKGTYGVSAGRSFDTPGGLLFGIAFIDTYSANATWLIHENMTLSFLELFSKAVQLTDAVTKINTSTTQGELTYRFSPNMSGGIAYNYIDQHAENVTAGTFYVHRVVLFLKWEGAPWR